MKLRAGRYFLILFSLVLLEVAIYELATHLYADWIVWDTARNFGYNFWDVQYQFWFVFLGAVAFVAMASLAVAWNLLRRRAPATEASLLFWGGLALAVGFGWQFEVALAYLSVPYMPDTSDPPATYLVKVAIPTAIGLAMILASVYQGMRGRRTVAGRADSIGPS